MYRLKAFNDSKAFIEYSNNMNDIYKNIAAVISNKKLNLKVTRVRVRKLNIITFLLHNLILLYQKILD